MVGISRYINARRFLAVVGLLTPVFLSVTPASAATTPSTNSNAAAQSAAETLVQRLAKQKSAFPTKLTAAQQTKLTIVCKPAQAKVSTLVQGTKTSLQRRSTRYQEVQTKLQNLTQKLESSSYDLASLKAQQETLKELVAAYETSQANYQTALNDLKDVDCAADPTGFDALLSAARSARAQVVSDSGAVHDFVRTKITPTLQEAKQALAELKKTKEQN